MEHICADYRHIVNYIKANYETAQLFMLFIQQIQVPSLRIEFRNYLNNIENKKEAI